MHKINYLRIILYITLLLFTNKTLTAVKNELAKSDFIGINDEDLRNIITGEDDAKLKKIESQLIELKNQHNQIESKLSKIEQLTNKSTSTKSFSSGSSKNKNIDIILSSGLNTGVLLGYTSIGFDLNYEVAITNSAINYLNLGFFYSQRFMNVPTRELELHLFGISLLYHRFVYRIQNFSYLPGGGFNLYVPIRADFIENNTPEVYLDLLNEFFPAIILNNRWIYKLSEEFKLSTDIAFKYFISGMGRDEKSYVTPALDWELSLSIGAVLKL